MVKMSLGNSTSQGSSTSSISSSRISAYNGAISSLNSFIGASNLQGNAYSSAKSYASTVLIPLIQGAILLSEAVSNAVTTFPNRYTSEVAGESLDSEVLEAQIATYQAAYDRSSAWLTSEMSKKVLNESSILRAQQSMARNLGKVTELQEKLDKLMAFNASSPSLFDEISGLYSAVSQGLGQVSSDYNSFNKTKNFPEYNSANLSWVQTINAQVEEKNSLSNVQQATLLSLSKNEKSQQTGQASKDGYEKLKALDEPDLFNRILDVTGNVGDAVRAAGGWTLSSSANRLSSIVDKITTAYQGGSKGFVILNTDSRLYRYSYPSAVQSVKTAERISKVGKVLSNPVTQVAAFGIGVWDDIENGGMTTGEAVVHTGASTVVGLAASAGTTALITAIAGGPVGWAALAGVGVGYAAIKGFDWMYENNVMGMKDGLDAAGQWVDDRLEDFSNSTIGEAIIDSVSTINPFD